LNCSIHNPNRHGDHGHAMSKSWLSRIEPNVV
jgi:hypothetical protein